jgi:hypothetical protein
MGLVRRIGLRAIGVGSLAVGCVVSGAPLRLTPVEVWCGGDDGLTLGLRDALERHFRSAVGFLSSSGQRPGTLVVLIPSHVGWTRADSRTRVQFNVRFESVEGQVVGTSDGACWEDELEECVARIAEDASVAATRLRR